MKKLTLLLIGVLTLTFMACDDDNDKGSYPPTYQGFRVSPSVVYPGDSVFITAVQQRKGHYLNATTYSWSMTIMLTQSDGSTVKEELYTSPQTNYGGIDSSDPTWRLYIPESTAPGIYTCKFEATWSNSADGIGGSFSAGTGEGCVGTITSYSYTLYSQANGNFRLTIHEKP